MSGDFGGKFFENLVRRSAGNGEWVVEQLREIVWRRGGVDGQRVEIGCVLGNQLHHGAADLFMLGAERIRVHVIFNVSDLTRRSKQMATQRADFSRAVEKNASDFGLELSDAQLTLLADYYELLMKWNARLHLVAPCPPEEFAIRHVLESLWLLRHLSPGADVLDVGSGGGLPIIPCLLIRED